MAMYAISQQHPYAYSAAPVPAPPPARHSANGTSSAFSSSAHPDEDWTKISDLAERRRIQNRIAQRNYRKKLKRRLEDLERRAGSEDGESEKQSPSTTQSNSPSKITKRQSAPTKSHKTQQQAPAPVRIPTPTKTIVSQGQFTPPMEAHEELAFGSHHTYNSRERSNTPPVFSYGSYPAPDELLMNPYGPPHAYPTMTTTDSYPNYLTGTTMPTPLPSLGHYCEPVKREMYPGHDGMGSYLGYGFVPAVDMNMATQYDASNPLTPPLSHSYDHSAPCSETGFEYPTTPLSMPGSPGLIHHHQQH